MAPLIPWYRLPMQWVRRLYDWTLHWASTPYGAPALFLLAFAEASFFPIPPDVLLLALALGRRERAFHYAALCTLGSVLGGVAGWWLGRAFWAALGVASACPEYSGGALLLEHFPGFTCEKFGIVESLYRDNAWMALFTAAFTPIPYKIFTVAGGVFDIPLGTLMSASVVGRGARFFLVGGLIYAFGAPVRRFIERRFEAMTLLFTALLAGGFLAMKYLL